MNNLVVYLLLNLVSYIPGRWHCVECAICKSCGARSPGGAGGGGAGGAAASTEPAEWHHQTRRGLGGHKVYSHSLCTPCARSVPHILTLCSLLTLVLFSHRSLAVTVIALTALRPLVPQCTLPKIVCTLSIR